MGNYMWLDYLPSTAGQIRFGVIKAKSGENVDGDLRGKPRLGKRKDLEYGSLRKAECE